MTEANDEATVHQALDNAIENEADVHKWSIDEIVEDMLDCCGTVEDWDAERLRPHVESWLKARGYR